MTILTATIANGASLSNTIELNGDPICMIQWPAAWTAASVTFQVSGDGSSWADLLDEYDTEVSRVVTAGKARREDLKDWMGINFLRLRSGTSATPVNQGAERQIKLSVFS